MSLHSFTIHKMDQSDTTPFLPTTHLHTATISLPIDNKNNLNFLKNCKIADFFKSYQCIFSIYSSNLLNIMDIDLHSTIKTYQEKWSSQISSIHQTIEYSRKMINVNPNLAIETIEKMINMIELEFNTNPTYEVGSRALKEIVVKLSADIQEIKNEINTIFEKKNVSNERLKASPIYIKPKY